MCIKRYTWTKTDFHYLAWDHLSPRGILSFYKANLRYSTVFHLQAWASICGQSQPWILLIIQFITNAAQSVAAQRVHQLKTLSAIMCDWVGGGGQQRGKNVIFKNNPFPLNSAISRLFPVYSGCEISDVRAFVTACKGVSNNKGRLHPDKNDPFSNFS